MDKESETETTENSIENMKKVLKGKKLTIIGGHQDFINYLKQEFPDWTYTANPVNDNELLARIILEKQTRKWTIVDIKNKLIMPTPFAKNQMEQAQNRAEMIYLMNRSREA